MLLLWNPDRFRDMRLSKPDATSHQYHHQSHCQINDCAILFSLWNSLLASTDETGWAGSIRRKLLGTKVVTHLTCTSADAVCVTWTEWSGTETNKTSIFILRSCEIVCIGVIGSTYIDCLVRNRLRMDVSTVKNPHLKSLENDRLFHIGLDANSDLKNTFGDVKVRGQYSSVRTET